MSNLYQKIINIAPHAIGAGCGLYLWNLLPDIHTYIPNSLYYNPLFHYTGLQLVKGLTSPVYWSVMGALLGPVWKVPGSYRQVNDTYGSLIGGFKNSRVNSESLLEGLIKLHHNNEIRIDEDQISDLRQFIKHTDVDSIVTDFMRYYVVNTGLHMAAPMPFLYNGVTIARMRHDLKSYRESGNNEMIRLYSKTLRSKFIYGMTALFGTLGYIASIALTSGNGTRMRFMLYATAVKFDDVMKSNDDLVIKKIESARKSLIDKYYKLKVKIKKNKEETIHDVPISIRIFGVPNSQAPS